MAKPLAGIRVVEFTHVVMGPLVGKVLQELGAEVTHIEPPGGDPTRAMQGFGKGFFTFYNHGKRCEEIDLKSPSGQERIEQILSSADVLVENYAPRVMGRLGLGEQDLRLRFPRLIYCSLKGFLEGPYEQRIAVDEVVQMMGGLAYMTGLPGQPMRAGTSALDITGGLFGVIGILTALFERHTSGQGKFVSASLFESSAFLMGQFMAGLPLRHTPAGELEHDSIAPMPSREQIWAVYQLFETRGDKQVFLAVVSDKHWQQVCTAFDWQDLAADARYSTGAARLEHQQALVDIIAARLRDMAYPEVIRICRAHNLPFGEVNSPADLLTDEHLNVGGHLVEITMADGSFLRIPRLPLTYRK